MSQEDNVPFISKNRNIVVIGGTNGIGESIWKTLIKRQSSLNPASGKINIFIVGRDENKSNEINNYNNTLNRSDVNIKCISKDIAGGLDKVQTTDEISKIILDQARHFFNEEKIDMLFLNAGVLLLSPQGNIEPKYNDYLWNTNFFAIKSLFLTAVGENSNVDVCSNYLSDQASIVITNSLEGAAYLATPNNNFKIYSFTKKILHKQTNIWRQKYPQYFITELFPSAVETAFWNITNGVTGERGWNKSRRGILVGQEEGYLGFKSFSPDQQAERFIIAVNQRQKEVFSCLEDQEFLLRTKSLAPQVFILLFYADNVLSQLNSVFQLLPFFLFDGVNNLSLLFEFTQNGYYLEDGIVTQDIVDLYIEENNENIGTPLYQTGDEDVLEKALNWNQTATNIENTLGITGLINFFTQSVKDSKNVNAKEKKKFFKLPKKLILKNF